MNSEQPDRDQDLEFDRSQILITKLYRPPVPPNAEPRTALLAQLERNRHRTMTLISAPPGYGKTTLASMWMETTDWPSAWVSLDEEDNSFSSFLVYLLAALRQLIPEMKMLPEELLHSSIPSPPAVIARYLLNDLAQADTSFMLVLDDLNLVREPKVSEVLAELLRHPARTMHLVVISRRDPPLPLAAMRARRQMTEVRAQDLRFTVTEAGGMLSKALSREIDERTAAAWVEQTEGWVTALHLAALSLRHRKEHEGLGPAEPVGGQYLQDYLLDEVLAKVPPEYLPWLLATALVDRFCASLCEALSRPAGRDEASEKSLGGEEFVRWLQEANLFVVALDAERRWFRYHHLFRQLLVDALLRHPQPVDAVAVHKRASHWFVQHGLIEEAIRHDLDAGDTASATQLVAQHRHGPINADQWHELDRWLRQFPEDVVANDPILTLSQARLPAAYGQRSYLLVERAGYLAGSLPADAPNRSEVLGELAFFTALQAVLAGPGVTAIEKGAEAFSLLPPTPDMFAAWR